MGLPVSKSQFPWCEIQKENLSSKQTRRFDTNLKLVLSKSPESFLQVTTNMWIIRGRITVTVASHTSPGSQGRPRAETAGESRLSAYCVCCQLRKTLLTAVIMAASRQSRGTLVKTSWLQPAGDATGTAGTETPWCGSTSGMAGAGVSPMWTEPEMESTREAGNFPKRLTVR